MDPAWTLVHWKLGLSGQTENGERAAGTGKGQGWADLDSGAGHTGAVWAVGGQGQGAVQDQVANQGGKQAIPGSGDLAAGYRVGGVNHGAHTLREAAQRDETTRARMIGR